MLLAAEVQISCASPVAVNGHRAIAVVALLESGESDEADGRPAI